MKIVISENQYKRLIESENKLIGGIQKLVNDEVDNLKDNVDELDMDEMSMIYQIESLNRIEVVDVQKTESKLIVFLDIYKKKKNPNQFFSDLLSEMERGIRKYIPNVVLKINNIIQERK